MTRVRSAYRCGTDYTGVPLEDICQHLSEWKESTQELCRKLEDYRLQVVANGEKLDHADEVLDFILFSGDLFARFLGDYHHLLSEIPSGVTEAHVEIISQMVERSDYHEQTCVQFKNDHIVKDLRDETMRPLLDRIYGDTRDEIVNYSDLHNVIPRLKTYVGSKSEGRKSGLSVDDTEALELKPNIFGIGLNLNYIIKRIGKAFGKRT
ncbi:MAG: hypothetical protein C0399_02565 [Syntrophus sp. (in: bacteria)]|nr:hypothetical protein [Syntrophus sp. (in: bacteria)]